MDANGNTCKGDFVQYQRLDDSRNSRFVDVLLNSGEWFMPETVQLAKNYNLHGMSPQQNRAALIRQFDVAASICRSQPIGNRWIWHEDRPVKGLRPVLTVYSQGWLGA